MAGTETTVEVLEQRLDRLERENRCWRWAAATLAIGIATAALMGQAAPNVAKVVEAEKFVLRDTNGRLRAELSVGAEGAVVLGLLDPEGKSGATLSVAADGAVNLHLYDRQGQARLGLSVLKEGVPALRLDDRDGKPRVTLARFAQDIYSPEYLVALMTTLGVEFTEVRS